MTTRTKIIIAVVALLVLGGAAYWYFSKDKEKPEEDKPADKPAPKTPEPKTVNAKVSAGSYPATETKFQDIPVMQGVKIVPTKETVSGVKVAQNPPPRTMAPSAGISVTKDGTTVAPSKVVKLSSTSPKGGKFV